MSKMITMSRNTKTKLHVDSVPAFSATLRRAPRLPASANAAATGMNRFASISTPRTVLIIGVSAVRPAKAEPLLPPAEMAA